MLEIIEGKNGDVVTMADMKPMQVGLLLMATLLEVMS